MVSRFLLLFVAFQQPAAVLSAAPRLRPPAAAVRPAVRPRSARMLLFARPTEPATPATVVPEPARWRPRVLLGALVLVYVSNQWARALPASLVSFSRGGTGHEFMNVALGMDEVRYGWLSSYAFTLLYALTSLAAGAACDSLPRGPILLVAAAGWGSATALQSCATSYPQLLASRAALGVSQAFCSPAAYPMIGQAFAREGRAFANSIYSSGLYIGYALASLSAVLTRALGWRQTSCVVAAFCGLSTLVLAIALRVSSPSPSGSPPPVALPPPPRGSEKPVAATARDGPSAISKMRAVLGTRSAAILLAASTTRSFGGYAVGAWCVPFFRQYHAEHAADFAVANGVFIAVAATISTIAGGWLADRLVSGGGRAPADGSTAHRALFVPFCGCLLAIPLWLGVLQCTSFVPSMACLLCAYLVAECWFGALTSTMQGALPPAVWGTALGLVNAVQVFSNGSPLLIGTLVKRGVPLRDVLSLVIPCSHAVRTTSAPCAPRPAPVTPPARR